MAVDTFHIPPSRYLKLPWPEWGEEDFLLTQGYDQFKSNICPCGCGFWESECTDPDNQGKFIVEETTFYAQAALAKWREDNPEPSPGVQPALRLLASEMSEADYARAEIAAMRARHNLT